MKKLRHDIDPDDVQLLIRNIFDNLKHVPESIMTPFEKQVFSSITEEDGSTEYYFPYGYG